MVANETIARDINEPDYDVHFLDSEAGFSFHNLLDNPLAQLAPSYCIYDSERKLLFWSIRPEDNFDDLASLFYRGMALEDLTEKAVKIGLLDTAQMELRRFIDLRLERFASSPSTFECQLSGDRWFRVSDKRRKDGTTITTIVNITNSERRERALAMLLATPLDETTLFDNAARALATGLGFRTASIARLLVDGTAETIACYHNGELRPLQHFVIRGTPCEPVYRSGYFAFTGDFLKRFPLINLDDYFTEIGHGSYVGQVIYSASGVAVGHVLALDETERTFDDGDRRLIRLIAQHVGAEMQRLSTGHESAASEERLDDFAASASELFLEINSDLVCTYVSPRALDLTGISADSWLGRNLSDMGGAGDAAWQDCLATMTQQQTFSNVRVSFAIPGSEAKVMACTCKPVMNADKQLSGYRLIFQPLAAEPAAIVQPIAARQGSARLQQVLNSNLEAFALYDSEQRLSLCNDKFRSLLFKGREHQITIGRSVYQLAHLWLEHASKAERQSLINFHMEPDALVGDHLDIQVQDQQLRVIRRRTEEGGIATFYFEITDLKLRERELLEAKNLAESANSIKSRFLANVSHELRTPLNAVIGFADVMREQMLGPIENTRYLEYVGDIRASGEHLLDMINDILDLSKAEAEQLDLSLELIDISEIVNSVVRLMREQVETARLDLVAQIHISLPQIEGDKRRLKQVLINLVSNAIKFTPAGGKIEVTAEAKNDQVIMAVKDTGIGIAPDELARVLVPFGQVDSEISRRHKGTGLGLPLAKQLVELHRGTLKITSQPGQGTRVAAYFPVAAGKSDSKMDTTGFDG